ncbi:MAG: polyprenyl glycosylphosphotransferase [Chloroflexi bacterium]|nr:MAG: polyprenyl glycosylphosphotransferase [Chloroflexota bacterium]
MFRRFGVNFAVLSLALDACLTTLAFILAISLRPHLPNLPFLVEVETFSVPSILFFLVPLLWVLVFLLASVYDPKRIYKIVDELQLVTLATGFAALLFAGLLYLAFRDFSRWLFITFVLLDLTFLIGWRLIARIWFKLGHFRSFDERRILIIGGGEVGQRVGELIAKNQVPGLSLLGFLDDHKRDNALNAPLLGKIIEARRIVSHYQINDVVIALPFEAYGQVNKLILELNELPVQLRVIPDYFSLTLYRATVDDFSGIPMINLRDPMLNDYQRLFKRIFDLFVGSIIMFFVLPLMSIIAIAVKLDSPGPVIFKQERVGENGRIFHMFKFRSMINGAEKIQNEVAIKKANGEVLHKHPNDPRVTRVGKFIRRTSLDELPQLFNVLQGTMSLVGPRPELPWLLNQYDLWQHKRFAVPQGMTGWWQVNGRADNPMHLNAEDDLYYVQNYSLWMDIYILLKTPWVVLRGKGAY